MLQEQKELLLLWIMLTANRDYSPAGIGKTAATSISDIATAFNNAPGTTGWNWNALTVANATALANVVFSTNPISLAPPAGCATTKYAEYVDIIGDFKSAAAGLSSSGAPGGWPAGAPAGSDHPTVAEIKAALRM